MNTPLRSLPIDMGLGKTMQSVALLSHLRRAPAAPLPAAWPATGPALVVSPLSILSGWESELKTVRGH